ncbi:hypothetical protein FJZ36_03890 [Candidatus Poribacteria bacterium]|nr:hypothetical protein [Candidatus Poribacteria bacterium]
MRTRSAAQNAHRHRDSCDQVPVHGTSRWEAMTRFHDREGRPVVGLTKTIRQELAHHLPFTALAVLTTVLVLGLVSQGRTEPWQESRFEFLHYVHLFASAIATTAVFWRYQRNALLAVGTGAAGSVIFCTLSDIVLPFLGGRLFGLPVSFGLELVESPLLVLGMALGGSLVGFVRLRHLSIYSHSLHVFVSSFASLMYLLTHTSIAWFGWSHAPALVAVLVVAVFVPCCMSDLVMPVACTHCGLRDGDRSH